MIKNLRRISIVLCLALLCALIVLPATGVVARAEENAERAQIVVMAEEEQTENADKKDEAKGSKAIAAAIAVGLAAALGALAMGIAIAKSNEAIARQPEATSQIKSGLMLGLVFIETAIIYALIVAILVIFVL